MLGKTLKDASYGHFSALNWFSKNTEASANASSVLAIEPHGQIDFHLVPILQKIRKVHFNSHLATNSTRSNQVVWAFPRSILIFKDFPSGAVWLQLPESVLSHPLEF